MPSGPRSVAILRRPGSTLAERVASSIASEVFVVDAASRRLAVDGADVVWDGVALCRLGALLVERPEYAWPQPALGDEVADGDALDAVATAAAALREERALRVSALLLAAGCARVVNDPELAAELMASSACALERLAAAGIATRPWRLGRAHEAGGATALSPLLLDGPAPPAGDVALLVDAPGPALSALVVGGRVVAAEERTGLHARHGAPADPTRAFRAADALAALGLDLGVVHLCAGQVALVESAPDLAAWDDRHGDVVARSLADLLLGAAREDRAVHTQTTTRANR